MKVIKAAILLGAALFALPALSATDQQTKMKTCNADASKKELKGDARQAFMKECLSAKAEAKPEMAGEKALTPQQEKMKKCNMDAKAKSLKGEERKKFMSACLKS